MADVVKLRIAEIVGSPIWVSSDDGQRVFDKIVAAFTAGRAVDLSFAQHENLITAFLNAAIGQLYSGTYEEAFLNSNLHFSDISDDDREMLQRAVDNAKRYFSSPKPYDQAWGEVVDEE